MILSQETLEGLKSGRMRTKMRAGGRYVNVVVTVEENRMFFSFPFYRPLLNEVKTVFEKRRWHGFIEGDNRKLWSAPFSQRNFFQLEALQGKYRPSPYTHWNRENWTDHTKAIRDYCLLRDPPLKPYIHQVEMVNQALNGHWFIWAAEMGTGKTLAAIIAMEMSGMYEYGHCFWLGPRSALVAARAEFRKWNAKVLPEFFTYDGLKKKVKEWKAGDPAPKIMICDESSLCKTPTSQRSVAAQHVADSMRAEHGWDRTMIGLLSGTPAPKTPADWWSQAEIACPGFLSEGNIFLFRERLGHMEEVEHTPGAGSYKKLRTWKDSDDKCKVCGEIEGHPNHNDDFESQLMSGQANESRTYESHQFKRGVNEVANLKIRLDGLVGTWLKQDCLDLPEKRYEIIYLEPTTSILNQAKAIVNNSSRAADALIRLRTLSDGFLYEDTPTGIFEECNGCKGHGTVVEYFDPEFPHDILLPEEVNGGFRYIYEECPPEEDPVTFIPEVVGKRELILEKRDVPCHNCKGKKVVEKTERNIIQVACPKIDLLHSLLEQHEEAGRFNVYAGFTGSIERVKEECLAKGWMVMRADGRGWETTHPVDGLMDWSADEAITAFQERQDEFPKMVFDGQPGAAGMGLTLTAAPTTFFYSNDFNPQNRMQAEARGHRIGMDIIRGGRIVDCVHLPSDEKVIDSLKKSKQLQTLSLKGLQAIFD